MVLRRLHAAAALIWVAALVVQVFLAGQALANLGGSGDFSAHIDVGYTIGIVQLAVLVLAAAARLPRRDVGIAAGVLVLYIVQTLLPLAKTSAAWIAALHPLNAMVLFALSIWYARHAWQAAMAPAPAPRGTPTAEPAEAKLG
jgi:energy-coupling factor transporter transmembrane protein EcfT